jgi:hypothetical protein
MTAMKRYIDVFFSAADIEYPYFVLLFESGQVVQAVRYTCLADVIAYCNKQQPSVVTSSMQIREILRDRGVHAEPLV